MGTGLCHPVVGLRELCPLRLLQQEEQAVVFFFFFSRSRAPGILRAVTGRSQLRTPTSYHGGARDFTSEVSCCTG